MTILELFEWLRGQYGERSDPDVWWPVYLGRADPPRFERAITNILVTRSTWKVVRRAVEALDAAGLLTATALAEAAEEAIAACVKPTGFQAQKARSLKALGAFVVSHYQTEAVFCANATRTQLLALPGIGPETADRTLLYVCNTLAWPVDTYCLRLLARHAIIPSLPETPAQRARLTTVIKAMVAEHMPAVLEDWQRLHALLQIAGEDRSGM